MPKHQTDNKVTKTIPLFIMIGIVIVMLMVGLGTLFYILNSDEPLITISGSNTIGEELMPELAKAYLKDEIKAENVKIRSNSSNEYLIVGWVQGKKKNSSESRRKERQLVLRIWQTTLAI